MADCIGLVASIIAVIELTARVTTLSYGYIGGVKRASKDLGELVDELGSLGKIMISLHDYAGENRGQKPGVLQTLRESLQRCTDELESLKTKLEHREGWKGTMDTLKWPLKEKETLQQISRIERFKGLFMLALETDHISISREIKERVQKTNTSIKHIQKESIAQKSWREQDENLKTVVKRKTVLNWLHPENFSTKHIEISNTRQSETGKWLLKAPGFLAWEKETTNAMLWGYGIPGAGKTFLSSIVIDYLRSQRTASNYGVAYIYFDYKEQDRQRPVQVLSSLIKQLASQTTCLPIEIEDLHDKLEFEGERPSIEELYIALLATSKSFSRVFLVFDALDECDQEKQRKKLLPLFQRMGQDNFNIFLTSRPHPEDIQDSFEKKIELSAHDEDIRIYIEEKINTNPRAKRLVRQGNCKDRIISELLHCAKGMFLLVHFHIEYLCRQTTAKQILTELESLKNSSTKERPLDPTYDRAMGNLHRQPKPCSDLAFRILSWLVKARRTLSIDEIKVAVSVEPGRYELDDLDLPDLATLLDVCAGLVTIDENSNTIRLAHYTVQEYLLRSLVLPESDFDLALTCTTFLSFDIFAQGACNSYKSFKARIHAHPFLGYAAQYLPFHIKSCEELTTEIVLKFLHSPGNISTYVQTVIFREDDRDFTEMIDFCKPREQLPLHIAASIGHRAVVHFLLENGADPLALDNFGRTPLYEAAFSGHQEVVLLLLDHGADIMTPNSNGHTALHRAASRGHEGVVRILLEKGADLSVPDHSGRTALHSVASRGHESLLRLLINKGADLSIRDHYGRTVLYWAASGGHSPIVDLLLGLGADFSIPDSYGRTPLHRAAFLGKAAVARILLEKGADFHAQENDGRTPLHEAAFSGHEAVFRVLLDKGADISIADRYGHTILHDAASRGHEALVLLLLENGADPSAKDNHGRTVLYWAVFSGKESVVRLLLEKSAAVLSAQNKDGKTALHVAVSRGHEGIVRLLLIKGVDFSIPDNAGWTAMHEGMVRGNQAVIRLLKTIERRRSRGEEVAAQVSVSEVDN